MTTTQETAVRSAATTLLTAINDAKAVGLDVRWPSFPGGLAVIAISETGKVGAATGVKLTGIEAPADGVMREVPVFSVDPAKLGPVTTSATLEAQSAPLAQPAATPVADALAAKTSAASTTAQ